MKKHFLTILSYICLMTVSQISAQTPSQNTPPKFINNKEMEKDTYRLGLEKLQKISGAPGEQVVKSFDDISSDLGKLIIEYSYGTVYAREGLDVKSKEIAVVAALIAMGTANPQLKIHIHGALNTGSSINEIKEIILQMSIYSGFPACINAMNALKEVLKERKNSGIIDNEGNLPSKNTITNKRKMGEQALSQLDSSQVEVLNKAFDDFSPDLLKYIIEHGYDILSRDNLSKKHRQIATIAALTAMGNAQPQLKFHIKAGLNIGITEAETKEIMILMTVFSGFPSAINGINILREVIAEK